MGINKYQPHVFVLPEDDANRQIANRFILNPNLNSRAIQVLPEARGWENAVEIFTNDYAVTMRQYPHRMIVLLIDFDEDEGRLSYVQNQIPEDLNHRVFIIGVLSEPEKLKTDIRKNFESIGEALATDCSNNTNKLWEHNLLKHNKTELERMILSVKPFLFNEK
ncbi:hypothetical protein [Halotia branconii]|uniref:Uncharacterized protein n=1 Tax=Halotia branconii CENA392 TaxID=1539056 RepID=A0AAJ6P9G0_9CYAN|nr:hypothetical protein [Halotia branconii]WGV25647.1 hypothetical protein QI031_28665 [Halotia branconii CENA392]